MTEQRGNGPRGKGWVARPGLCLEALEELLDVILMVHPVRARSSGLTRPFDFHNEVEGLEYLKTDPTTGLPVRRVIGALAEMADNTASSRSRRGTSGRPRRRSQSLAVVVASHHTLE